MTWFNELTGIEDESPSSVRKHLIVQDSSLISKANSRVFGIGELTQPRLNDLRTIEMPGGAGVSLSEIVADVQDLHTAPENAGAAFQVASQFNLLEMIGPSVTPEQGVGRYERDRTQGPACAIACGASTIYRNYFLPVDGGVGQTHDRQVDCLHDFGSALENDVNCYWEMSNGYALPAKGGLERLNTVLVNQWPDEREELLGQLRIGISTDAEVTLKDAGHKVTQIFCSAMPVSYGVDPVDGWRLIGKLVLDAAYEATLRAAVANAARTGNNRVFLTLLGGGAFGNKAEWIASALLRALHLVRRTSLDVRLVSYGGSSPIAQDIFCRWKDGVV